MFFSPFSDINGMNAPFYGLNRLTHHQLVQMKSNRKKWIAKSGVAEDKLPVKLIRKTPEDSGTQPWQPINKEALEQILGKLRRDVAFRLATSQRRQRRRPIP